MADKPDPHIRLVESIGRLEVWLVNDRVVRDSYDSDFDQGANDLARPDWMPAWEIWIAARYEDELPEIELHEVHERNDMYEFHYSYEHAHDIAKKLEGKGRANRAKLPQMLEKERARCLKLQEEKLGADAEFEEGKHPRDDSGKFGSGGAGSGERTKPLPAQKMREYTPKELDWEYDVEYGKYSKSFAPTAFSSREDFQRKYDAAPLRSLSEKEFTGLGNSMAASGIGRNADWVHKTFGHRRNTKAIIDALENGQTAPPIVLKKGEHLRLMAGQTRLAAAAALGYRIPVKIMDVGKPAKDQAEEETEYEDEKMDPEREERFTTDMSLIEIINPGAGSKEEDVAPQGISSVVHVYPGEEGD